MRESHRAIEAARPSAAPGSGSDPRDPLTSILHAAVVAAFVVLGAALVTGRLPLPWGESFGYGSWARNVVLVALAARWLGGAALPLRPSPLGWALLAYAAVAALSVAANRGSWSDARMLAVGVGIFFTARAIGARARSPTWLLDWLGAVVVGIVAREILADPLVLLLRESARDTLATDHPNTLGYALAVLAPLFIGASAAGPAARRAALYAVATCFGAAATYSRAAWLAIALAIAVIATIGRPRGERARRGTAAWVAIGLTVAVAIAVGYLSLGRGAGDQQRLRIIAASLTLFREHWLLGVGFGSKNLSLVFPSRYIELFGASLFLFHSHNLYVDALVGTGVVGALAAAWLVLRLASLARRAMAPPAHAVTRSEGASFAAAIGAFLFLGLADMPFYHGRLTILVAVALAHVDLRVAAKLGPPRRPRPAPVAGAAGRCPPDRGTVTSAA
jgi:O-antigen ligase